MTNLQINYPRTTFALHDLTDPIIPLTTSLQPAGLVVGSGEVSSSVLFNQMLTPNIIPAQITDAVASTGTAGQYLTASVSGESVMWTDLPTLSLADVLAVDSDANQVDITNLSTLSLLNTVTSSAVVLGSASVSGTNIALNVNTLPDSSGATKNFSRLYLPIGVGGVIYYLPLFEVPAPT